jgi:general secretion pathway protein I
MVSIAILGLGLTAILSAQAGAFASSSYARNLSVAVGLSRCKMTEVEEHLLREGFQELDETESGPCCDDDDSSTMTCTWKVEKLKLPEPQYGQLDLGAGLNLGGALGAGGGSGASGGAMDMQSMVSGVVSILYPTMQQVFEESTRRITVTVSWKEGNKDQSIEVMQWFTSSAALIPDAGTGEGGASQGFGFGNSGSGTGTGKGGTPSPTPTRPGM